MQMVLRAKIVVKALLEFSIRKQLGNFSENLNANITITNTNANANGLESENCGKSSFGVFH